MAKAKAKAKKKRVSSTNNWIKAKSIIWQEVKASGKYDYHSDEFNKLVNETYTMLGHRDKKTKKPATTKQIIYAFYGAVEAEALPKNVGELISYHQIDSYIRGLKENPKLVNYNVFTSVKTPKNIKIANDFSLKSFSYQKSGFKKYVDLIDKIRKAKKDLQTPTSSIRIVIDPLNKAINISDANVDELPFDTKINEDKLNVKTVKKLKAQIEDDQERVKELKTTERLTNKFINKMIENPGMVKDRNFLNTFADMIKANMKERKQLNNRISENNESIKKYEKNKRKRGNRR